MNVQDILITSEFRQCAKASTWYNHAEPKPSQQWLTYGAMVWESVLPQFLWYLLHHKFI